MNTKPTINKETLLDKMEKITEKLMDKTTERMNKETTLSRKTLKMISLSERLFATICTWIM